MWTVIREDALFPFEVRVTGIWNLAKAYRYVHFPRLLRELSFTLIEHRNQKIDNYIINK